MFSAKFRQKKLHEALSRVNNEFTNPKVSLEQYPTDVQTSSELIHLAQSQYGDIEGKMVADLGCGAGVLSIGSALLGASYVLGIDIDQEALELCQENIEIFDLENIDLLQFDVTKFKNRTESENDVGKFDKSFDTVITNPPFGTKNNEGIDMKFVEVALDMSSNAVYSFHKTATRAYIKKKSNLWNVGMEVLGEVRFLIPQIYKFHKSHSVDIEVDFIRFYHK